MLHSGHRERLRNKALEFGIDCLEDHEALELLLGYAIPRRNTNDIAHMLINKAGSLGQVFDLDMSELKRTEGMGEYSAFFLKLVRYVMKNPKKPPRKRIDLCRYEVLRAYISALFATEERETLYALYLDSKLSLIKAVKISSGSEWFVALSKRDIIKNAIDENAAGIILVHNHPGGFAKPSNEDYSFTASFEKACELLDMTLVEHIVYAGGDFHPIMRATRLNSLYALEYDDIKTDE